MSFVLEVQLRIKPENVDRFMKQVLENAQHARKEPGCKQFDVLVDPHDRTQVMLYEVYADERSEEHTSELQSLAYLVCRLLLEKKKTEAGRATAGCRSDHV